MGGVDHLAGDLSPWLVWTLRAVYVAFLLMVVPPLVWAAKEQARMIRVGKIDGRWSFETRRWLWNGLVLCRRNRHGIRQLIWSQQDGWAGYRAADGSVTGRRQEVWRRLRA